MSVLHDMRSHFNAEFEDNTDAFADNTDAFADNTDAFADNTNAFADNINVSADNTQESADDAQEFADDTDTEAFDDGTEVSEDRNEVFKDDTEVVENIEYVDDEEFSDKTLKLHLLSASVDRNETGMHPEAITAETVHYASALPEYPISAERGFAYVIDTRGIDQEDLSNPWKAMQYTTKRRGGPKPTSSAFLSDMPVILHKYRCTGIKQCRHLDSALKIPHYDANDHPYWEDHQRTAAIYRRPNNLQEDAIT
ncbi:hypothetical protein E4U51_001361 [Claviceps purpurea]|nr:hypothetical protein E4U51_001361 [Claviceps purpurea]